MLKAQFSINDEESGEARSRKRLILARHGETVANRDGLIIGQCDSPLTAKGIATARELARALKGDDISTIFSSSLGRALSTARIYAELLLVPILVRQSLAELSFGEWEGRPRLLIGDGRAALRRTWIDRPPGGESYQDADDRVSGLIREIESEGKGQTVLVVGHAGVNRVFLKLWLTLDPEVAIKILSPHDAVHVLGADGQMLHRWSTGSESPGLLLDEQ